MESGMCHLVYHLFDGPVYTYMAWTGIARSTVERLMEEQFELSDFVELRVPGDLKGDAASVDFPSSWNAML